MSNNGASYADQLAAFLRSDLGFSQAGVAGFEGNTETESNFNPAALNSTEGAIGWQQWEGSRRDALDQLAAALHSTETDPAVQEQFIAQEMQGYPQLLQELRTTSDPAQAAADVDSIYERSAGTTRQDRINNARSIYADLSSGRQVDLGTSASSPGAGLATVAQIGPKFPGGGLDPLNWPGDVLGAGASVAGKAAGGVLKVVLPFITKATFVVGGLGLVVLGMYRASAPVRERMEPIASGLAQGAAMAAA